MFTEFNEFFPEEAFLRFGGADYAGSGSVALSMEASPIFPGIPDRYPAAVFEV